MRANLRRLFRYLTRTRYIELLHVSRNRVELRSGGIETFFLRESETVVQGYKDVATFSAIECIRLHQPRGQEGPDNWYVTLELIGHRKIEVGQATDETDASIAAARIAGVTNRPVRLSR